MPTKAELEQQIKYLQTKAEKLLPLEDVTLYTPSEERCFASCGMAAETVLITPERAIYLCADCLSSLDCFLSDFNIHII